MRRVIVGVIVGVALIGGVLLIGARNTPSNSYETFGAVEQAVVHSGAKLYDVRTASEYTAGHFLGATNWPLQDIQAGNLPNVAKDSTVFVYCHSGNRSGQAAALLKEAGYSHVIDLHGLSDVQGMGGALVQ